MRALRWALLPAMAPLALLALACTTPPDAATPSPGAYQIARTVSPDDFALPELASGFRLQQVHHYDEPELGFAARYISRDFAGHIDVYVYPILLPHGVSLAHVLELQQQQVEQEIRLVAQNQGQAGPVEISTHAPGGALPPGFLGYREIVRGDATHHSHSFLTASHDLFFKVRFTLPDFGAGNSAAAFESFVDALSEGLTDRDPEQRALQVTMTATTARVAGDSSCGWRPWIMYGYAMQQMLASGRYLDTFERELEARSVALDIHEQSLEEGPCPAPYWEALSRAREAGLLREYFWSTHRDPIWEQPEGLDLTRYEAWAPTGLPDREPIPFPGILVHWAPLDETQEIQP